MMRMAAMGVLTWVLLTAPLLVLIFWTIPGGVPPARADESDLGAWFESLTVPGTGGSCCDLSDCRRLAPRDVRVARDGYAVRIDGAWLPVPPQAILPRKANPTGDAVVCHLPGRGILCFVRPPEA